MITSLDISTVSFLINYCKQHKITNKFTLASCLVYNNKKYNYRNNHAEINTLVKTIKQLNVNDFKNSTLVISGVGSSNECNLLKSSKPCTYCLNIINNFNIKRLVYTTSKDNKQLTINEELLK